MAARRYRLRHGFGQALFFLLAVGVQAVAVGGFQHQQVRRKARNRQAGDGALVVQGNVAGNQYVSLAAFQADHGRPQDVPGRKEMRPDRARDGDAFSQRHRDHAGKHPGDQVGVVKGTFPFLLRFLRHQLERVGQQDPHQVHGGGGGVNGGGGEGLVDQGQGADVVQVGVGDQDGITPPGFRQEGQVRQRIRADPRFPAAEPDPRVDQHAHVVNL